MVKGLKKDRERDMYRREERQRVVKKRGRG